MVHLTIALTTMRILMNIDRSSTQRSGLPCPRPFLCGSTFSRELDRTLLDSTPKRRGLERRVPSPAHDVTIGSR
jgi:hypothetical protein